MLRSGASSADGARRGADDLSRLREALGAAGLGLSGREISHLWCVLEGMLHLSNLVFVDADDGAVSGDLEGAAAEQADGEQPASAKAAYYGEGAAAARQAGRAAARATASAADEQLARCAALLGLPGLHSLLWEDEVRTRAGGVGSSAAAPGGGGVTASVRRTAARAADTRRALMEELHASLFHLINGRLNAALSRCLAKQQSLRRGDTCHAGLGAGGSAAAADAAGSNAAAAAADVAGSKELVLLSPLPSESLQVNGLPQLCAHYGVERLHALFVGRTLHAEQRRYVDERIGWAEVPLPETRGLLALLDGRLELDPMAPLLKGAVALGSAADAAAEGAGGVARGAVGATPLLALLELHSRGGAAPPSPAEDVTSAAAFCAELQRKHAHSRVLAAADPRKARAQPATKGQWNAAGRPAGADASGDASAFVVHHTAGSLLYDARALLVGCRGASLPHAAKLHLIESSNLIVRQVRRIHTCLAGGGA